MPGVIAADKRIVGDGEVARAVIAGVDADADVFKAAMFYGKAAGAGNKLHARLDCDIGIAKGNPLEVVVVGSLQVEQSEVAKTVKDHFAIAGGFDHDRFFGCAIAKEVVSTFYGPGRAVPAVPVVQRLVDAGMHQDDVARFY